LRHGSSNSNYCVSPQPKNKAEYGQGYYSDKLNSMRQGYVHPYHSQQNPLVFTHYNYMRTLFEAVGPEQVSPHYESLSRSRRGLIFLFAYIGTITSLSRMGSWSHNEWLRGLVFHHEFLMCWYIGYAETRHFTFLLGPKFTVFYNVYSRYETQQMCNQWADIAEEVQASWLIHTKEQMEYVRINKEYNFVKKRALANYLINQQESVRNHFHTRTSNMLGSIEDFENKNLKDLLAQIGNSSFAKVTDAMSDPTKKVEIQQAAFQSALQGIRDGVMTYKNDPLMPILVEEVNNRTAAYANMTPEEESNLLSLDDATKKIIAKNDRVAKEEFLHSAPGINHAGVRMHEKYVAYSANVTKH
jgi:hypothetical protein